jgi:hypothetical protein
VGRPEFTTVFCFLQRVDDQAIGWTVDATSLAQPSGQRVLCMAHAPSRAKIAAVTGLAELRGRDGSGSALSRVKEPTTQPVERLREFPRGRGTCFSENPDRDGVGNPGFDSGRSHT